MEKEKGPKVGDYLIIFFGKDKILKSGVVQATRFSYGSNEYLIGEEVQGWYDFLPEYGDKFVSGEIYNTKIGKILWDTKSVISFD